VMARNGGQAVEKATLDSLTRSLTPGEMRDVRYRLGTMYEQGVGAAPNLVLADQWYLLGSAIGDTRSRARSVTLERRMSPAQISQARAQSDDWLRRHTIKTASDAAAR
jgi:TPR repeat protein